MDAPIHPLRRWLFEKRISQDNFRVRVALNRTTLSFILSYRQSPSIEVTRRICEATDNELTLADFVMPEKEKVG